MINVEGNYEEIISWLDDQNGSGVQHSWGHDSRSHIREHNESLNFGLFSIVDDMKHGEDWSGAVMSFDPERLAVALEDWDQQIAVESYNRDYSNEIALEHWRQYQDWRSNNGSQEEAPQAQDFQGNSRIRWEGSWTDSYSVGASR